MNPATALRLIKKAKHTCVVTPRTSTQVDANENTILVDGVPSAPIDCFFTTPPSLRRAEVSTVEANGVTITHQVILPGGTVINRLAKVSDIRYKRGAADEKILHAAALEVGRLDTSLLPFILTLNVGEVS